MDAAINGIFDLLDREDDEYNAGMLSVTDQIRQLEPPPPPVPTARAMIEVVAFDPAHNILDPAVREEFQNETIFEDTHIFSAPKTTTNTMDGYFSNVRFHEEELIQVVIPDKNILVYKCNYGKVVYPLYVEPVKQKKTNRGRKKIDKKKKLRKKQGAGSDFNSQITFIIRSTLTPDPGDGVVPSDTKVYKFKVFRTGILQLPGASDISTIGDIIECTRFITQALNFYLHPGETNIMKLTNTININPVMKNYKFVIKMPPGHIIDMSAFRDILTREQARQDPARPPITMVKYSRSYTNLLFAFSTPIFRKPQKTTSVSVFLRGKVNILGAFCARASRRICEYIHDLIEQHYDDIIVPEGGVRVNPVVYEWVENIEQMDDCALRAHIDRFTNWLPRDTPRISAEDYDEIVEWIEHAYARVMAEAAAGLAREFAGTPLEDLFT